MIKAELGASRHHLPLGDGWIAFTPQQIGSDWDAAPRLYLNRSALDLSAITSATIAAAALGPDTIDGRECAPSTATVDAVALMNLLADAYGNQGHVLLANRFLAPFQWTS